MTTEKLDVVVVLVEVEIEVVAARRAFQQAGEYAGHLRDRRLFAACPFLERLHLFSDFLLGVPLCGRRVFSCKSSGQVDPM